MKKLIFLLITAFTFNAHAQLNLKWSHTQSLSGGIYKSTPVNISNGDGGEIYVASNEYNGQPAGMINGYITKYNFTGFLEWAVTLHPEVSLSSFHQGGIPSFTGMLEWLGGVVVVYNTDPSTSHLIKINSNGSIAFDVILNGINQVSCIKSDGSANIYAFGKTPQIVCGANMCNGVAVAKYDFTGMLEWISTNYSTGGFLTEPYEMALDNSGNVIVCGKKASYTDSGNDRDPFVLKYSSGGTLLWAKEFPDASTDIPSPIHFRTGGTGPSYTLAYETIDFVTLAKKCILKKITSAGVVSFTKTINNSELMGIYMDDQGMEIIATSIGMKAYNSSGTLLWQNNFIVSAGYVGVDSNAIVIAKNVSVTEPLSNFLVQLDANTGTLLLKKNLTLGNHDEYLGYHKDVMGEWFMLIEDTIPPYGTRVTKLSPCSAFIYSFTASASAVNVINATCNNGSITVNVSGTLNSWAHIELWKGANTIVESIDYSILTTSHTFQNLTSGTYTVKVFDESCGEQDFNVTVKCPAPVSGFTASFPSGRKATLGWNAVNCANGYQIQYRLSGAATWTTITSSTNNKTISRLTQGATYQWRVSTKCSGTNPVVYSDYSATQTFTMPSQFSGNIETAKDNREGIDQGIFPDPEKDNTKPGFNIFPNPSNGNFNVSVNLPDDNTGGRTIRIINMNGLVIKQLNMKEQKIMNINIEQAGIYFIQLISKKEAITKKLIVVH